MMPDEAKEPGLEELKSSLDKIVAEGEEVDEEIIIYNRFKTWMARTLNWKFKNEIDDIGEDEV